MTMWKDLTMQLRSDLMQATGIFDPVRLRLEYDAYQLAQGGYIHQSKGFMDFDFKSPEEILAEKYGIEPAVDNARVAQPVVLASDKRDYEIALQYKRKQEMQRQLDERTPVLKADVVSLKDRNKYRNQAEWSRIRDNANEAAANFGYSIGANHPMTVDEVNANTLGALETMGWYADPVLFGALVSSYQLGTGKPGAAALTAGTSSIPGTSRLINSTKIAKNLAFANALRKNVNSTVLNRPTTFETPLNSTHIASANTPRQSLGSLRFFERKPSNISEAERFGIPRGERNNIGGIHPDSQYGNLRFIRVMDGLPPVDESGLVHLGKDDNLFTNFTTDLPFRLHGNYTYVPGSTYLSVSPRAFKGSRFYSIEPSDSFLSSMDSRIEPKYIRVISGDQSVLDQAERAGMRTYTTDELKNMFNYADKAINDLFNLGYINKKLPFGMADVSAGDIAYVHIDENPIYDYPGVRLFDFLHSDLSAVNRYRKEIDRIFTEDLGRPTMLDYRRLEDMTGLSAGLKTLYDPSLIESSVKWDPLSSGDMFKNVYYNAASPVEYNLTNQELHIAPYWSYDRQLIMDDWANYRKIRPLQYAKGGYVHKYDIGGPKKKLKTPEEILAKYSVEPPVAASTNIVLKPVFTPQEKAYAAAQSEFFERHKSTKAEKKASRKARLAVKDLKAAEFGTLDVPLSNELLYAWRGFNNAKGSELLYPLPVVGEAMFGVDVADKLYSGDYGGAAKDLLVSYAVPRITRPAKGMYRATRFTKNGVGLTNGAYDFDRVARERNALTGNNFFHGTSAKSGNDIWTASNIGPNGTKGMYVSFGEVWPEHTYMPDMYVFPENTFGVIRATNSKGQIRPDFVNLIGRNKASINSARKYKPGDWYANVYTDAEGKGFRTTDIADLYDIHNSNQTVIPENIFRNAVSNTRYKIHRVSPDYSYSSLIEYDPSLGKRFNIGFSEDDYVNLVDDFFNGKTTVFSKGGSIHINPANKGKFNATKKRTGKTTEELTHSKNPLTRKRAIFAQNAKKWHHKDDGGYLDDIIWDNMGLWSHPGQITGIIGTKDGTDITMNGVADYLIGKDNLGNVKFMKPGRDYHFPGSSVVEYPISHLSHKAQDGKKLIITPELELQAKMRYNGYFNAMVNNGINPVYAKDAAYYATLQSFAEAGWKPNKHNNYGGMKNSKGLISYPSEEAYFDAWVKNANNKWPEYYKSKSILDWDEALNHTSLGLFDKDLFYKYLKKNPDVYIYAPAWENDSYLNKMQGVKNRMDGALGVYPDDVFLEYTYNQDPLNQGVINNQIALTYQYGGLIKPFSYTDIPVVRYGFGGYSYI